MSNYLDQNTQAARVYYKMVSSFVQGAKAWDDVVSYEVKPDERFNAPLISMRVYGSIDECLTVLACAGVDSFDDPIEQKTLLLPNMKKLSALKRASGFESVDANRRNGKPRWSRD